MKKKLSALLVVGSLMLVQIMIHAGPVSAVPLTQITIIQAASKAINYRNLNGSVEIDFGGTVLFPDARGYAKIRNRDGILEIDANFRELTPATQFGPEYMTYILWAISPDGQSSNLGELIIKNGKGRVSAKISIQAMSLIVTAEPYFAVSEPSSVMILENAIKPENMKDIELIDAKYELLPMGKYTKNTSIAPLVMDKVTPFYVYQARNAVRIAKIADADKYASEPFTKAESLLALAEIEKDSKKSRSMTAREAVQSAESSRSIAIKRQTSEALIDDFNQQRSQVKNANIKAAAATVGQSKAEAAQAIAEKAQGQSDNERAAALALATSAAATSAAAQADAKAARSSAMTSKGQADAANTRAEKAEGEKAALRAQLFKQLNSILQTQDTARGLIVSMPDALFLTGSSALQPKVREKMAKIAGIITSNPGLQLEIEGHTDNVGSDEYNQQLSVKRAQSARDYLVAQGVAAGSIECRGFGKNEPIASNDTAKGRKINRRVELIMNGDTIGSSASAK